jgi:hypothetical protein
MKNFINLTSCVINKLHIVEIVKKPNKYSIYMTNNSIRGVLFFASGELRTDHNIIEICEKNYKKDYDTITDLITSESSL